MFRKASAVNLDIFKINQHELVQEWSQDIVHGLLEGGRCVTQSKGHENELIVTIPCSESGLVRIVGMYTNLVIARSKVNLGEESRSSDFVQHLVNAWQWITIIDSQLIQGSLVHAHTHRPFLFPYEEDRCAVGCSSVAPFS